MTGDNRPRTRDIMLSAIDPECLMAQFVVRNLEDDVKERLKRRAERHGRSMEEEVREILRTAARKENQKLAGLGSRISARFRKSGLEEELPEIRGEQVRPAGFRKQ
jgi:antitoxin FitA